eukprot:2016433-Pyramimonas_sp.AAC.1
MCDIYLLLGEVARAPLCQVPKLKPMGSIAIQDQPMGSIARWDQPMGSIARWDQPMGSIVKMPTQCTVS